MGIAVRTRTLPIPVAALASPLGMSSSAVLQVSDLVRGKCNIGEARTALTRAGWHANIAGNRITVEDEVIAQYLGARVGSAGIGDPIWVVYPLGHDVPVRVTEGGS